MKKIITSTNAPTPIGPYSQAVMTENTVYVSGQICIDPISNDLMNKDIVSETRQVMINIGNILKEVGMDHSNIVKTTIFVKNLNDFAIVNSTYAEYFKKDPPARETVEVSRLPKDVNVEISCIAVGK